jgi:hypothetical protein
MILELLFFIFLVFAVCVLAYRGAVHEFQILQKEYSPDIEWSELLGEQLPIVIRNLPRSWLGAWTQQKTEHKTWLVTVRDAAGKKFRTTWNHWLSTPLPLQPVNMDEIASVSKLGSNVRNWYADGFSRWSWLPAASAAAHPHIFTSKDIQGVKKTTAEFTAIVSTDGIPLELWIAHEGAIPENVSDELRTKNPWIQTTKDIPWIGEVKYIEIKLRPGNAVIIPRHWYYAVRQAEEGAESKSWFWTSDFHTPISWLASLKTPRATR